MIECSKFVKFGKNDSDPRKLLESRSWLAETSGLYDAGSAFWVYHLPSSSSSSSWSGPHIHSSSPWFFPPQDVYRIIGSFHSMPKSDLICANKLVTLAPPAPSKRSARCPSPPPACLASRLCQRHSCRALSWWRVGTACWGHSYQSQLTVTFFFLQEITLYGIWGYDADSFFFFSPHQSLVRFWFFLEFR